ncbi:hypothetical protein LXL04_027198 [Taraxacum kok-saghyz]
MNTDQIGLLYRGMSRFQGNTGILGGTAKEFVAHSANVNCLKIGKKTHRNFITGGDDEKVNLWSIGKPNSITSLSGHTSPIESVAFDSTDVIVAAGASSGVIKLWDLEETKVVRTLNGHRSYCTAVEFHPFGEFLASGSMDTNLKIWDIRKKGCIHTYKGHRRAVSTIRFSPDGRWVVSGGLDNVVKIWDLTAGKLLHEFKFHEGHIKSMDFHPFEFLLATGSSDKTVKFWDLETFELIGTTKPEANGVRSVTFHPDGRSLFCGLDSSLKVYSWEPMICHDSLDMGWSTLGDICINDGKLVGCSYYQNSVAVWVADTSLIEQHGGSILKDRVVSPRISTISSDDDTKDIKNIYVDSVTPVSLKKPVPAVNLQIPKELITVTPPTLLPPSANEEQDKSAVPIKSSDRRRPSTTKLDIEGVSISAESGLKAESNAASKVAKFQKDLLPSGESVDVNKQSKSVKYVNGVAVVHGRTRSLVERFEKREKLNTDDESQLPDPSARISTNTDTLAPIKTPEPKIFTPEVTKIPLKVPEAESFKKPDLTKIPVKEPEAETEKRSDVTKIPLRTPEAVTFTLPEKRPDVTKIPLRTPEAVTFTLPEKIPDLTKIPLKTPEAVTFTLPEKRPDVTKIPSRTPEAETFTMPEKIHNVTKMPMKLPEVETEKRHDVTKLPIKTPEVETFTMAEKIPNVTKMPLRTRVPEAEKIREPSSPRVERHNNNNNNNNNNSNNNIRCEEVEIQIQRPRTAPSTMLLPEKGKASPIPRSSSSRRLVNPNRTSTTSRVVAPKRYTASSRVIPLPERSKISSMLFSPRHDPSIRMMPEKAKSSPVPDDTTPQTSGRIVTSKKYDDITESLLLNHNDFLSTLRSRLTKLQVVRHFWEGNDTRGAINALRKLPDHAVQADVMNILMERMESITLDLFSCLLPILFNLLDSTTERHISVSLELLLKLVAVFGPVVTSTISAPPAVGVDLHAEKRLEICNQCHVHLQKIHKCLPPIIRRGGLPSRCAQELNVFLQT